MGPGYVKTVTSVVQRFGHATLHQVGQVHARHSCSACSYVSRLVVEIPAVHEQGPTLLPTWGKNLPLSGSLGGLRSLKLVNEHTSGVIAPNTKS